MTDEEKLISRIAVLVTMHTIAATMDGIQLKVVIDPINNRFCWTVYEGDHMSGFDNYNDAIDYYLKVGGEL